MGYRIVSMDGGGLRGVITAKLLERLEIAHPGFLSQVDLFAGTSTGGILALGLAAGLTPARLLQLYTGAAAKVFADSLMGPHLFGTMIEGGVGVPDYQCSKSWGSVICGLTPSCRPTSTSITWTKSPCVKKWDKLRTWERC